MNNSSSQPQPQPKQEHKPNVVVDQVQDKADKFNNFMNTVDDVQIDYECWKCGKQQSTWAFQERAYPIGRGCEHNIDDAIA
ncbi:MAG: hypothetical protein ACPG2Y_02735, partial [Acholeplasmataceae bacterium]